MPTLYVPLKCSTTCFPFKMTSVKATHSVNRKEARFGCPDPLGMCELVVNSIPAEVLRNARNILDIGQGNCGISRALVKRMVEELDFDFYDAILRVVGVETDRALVNKAHRLGFIRTTHENFLSPQFDMQFDVIVGNPPYQCSEQGHSTYKSLWPIFWAKSFELLAEGGVVSLITPATWCSPTSDLPKKHAVKGHTRLWDVFSSYSSVADVDSIDSFFPGVGSSFSMVRVDTSGSDGLSFTNGYNSSLGFYPPSGADRVAEELSLDDSIGSRVRITGKVNEGFRVTLPKGKGLTPSNVEVCVGDQEPTSGSKPTMYAHIHCENEEEATHVRQRILDCADILNKHARFHGFIDLKVLGMIAWDKVR